MAERKFIVKRADSPAEESESDSDYHDDVRGVDDIGPIEEDLRPYTQVATIRAHAPESSIWNTISQVARLRKIAMSKLRFDIDSDHFKKTIKNSKNVCVDEYCIHDHRRNSDILEKIYERKPQIAIPPAIVGDSVVFKFTETPKTLTLSKSFMIHHSPVIAKVIEEQLFSDAGSAVQLSLVTRKTFKLIAQILYNPGIIGRIAVHLFRVNVLRDLLSAAEFLGISAIGTLIDEMVSICLIPYDEIRQFYLERDEGYSHGRLSEERIKQVTELLEAEPGPYAMENPEDLIAILDRFKLFNAVAKILAYINENMEDIVPIVKGNKFLNAETYLIVIDLLSKAPAYDDSAVVNIKRRNVSARRRLF